MMAYIEGKVLAVENDSCLIVNQGIGFKVFPVGVLPQIGESITLFLFEKIREDHRELFGFKDKETQRFFERMIEINGVGPKLAQKILNAGNYNEIARRILIGDISFLTSLPGVGKKTAQKIILELKGVIVEENPANTEDVEITDALMGLGYTKRDIDGIIQHLEGNSAEARLRYALKLLSR